MFPPRKSLFESSSLKSIFFKSSLPRVVPQVYLLQVVSPASRPPSQVPSSSSVVSSPSRESSSSPLLLSSASSRPFSNLNRPLDEDEPRRETPHHRDFRGAGLSNKGETSKQGSRTRDFRRERPRSRALEQGTVEERETPQGLSKRETSKQGSQTGDCRRERETDF
jgi:hypothetical protein